MSDVKYSMSGKHGLEMTEGGSVGRKKPPGWIAGGDGGGRRLWGEKICGLLVWSCGRLPNYLLSKRHSFIGTQRVRVKAKREKTHTLTCIKRDRHKHTGADFLLLFLPLTHT